VVEPGETLNVKILEIDEERRRLSLSIKQVEDQNMPMQGLGDQIQAAEASAEAPAAEAEPEAAEAEPEAAEPAVEAEPEVPAEPEAEQEPEAPTDS